MMTGGSSIRGYRPSYKVVRHDYSDNGFDVDKAKQTNLMIYAARVKEGIPLFDKQIHSSYRVK